MENLQQPGLGAFSLLVSTAENREVWLFLTKSHDEFVCLYAPEAKMLWPRRECAGWTCEEEEDRNDGPDGISHFARCT
jgi:hypothetical protein